MATLTLNVVDLLGTSVLLASEKGTSLKDAILSLLDNGQPITVDFAGYKFISSTFLNHSIGQVCMDRKMTSGEFHANVTIAGLSEDDVAEVDLVLYNAERRLDLLRNGINPGEFYSSRMSA